MTTDCVVEQGAVLTSHDHFVITIYFIILSTYPKIPRDISKMIVYRKTCHQNKSNPLPVIPLTRTALELCWSLHSFRKNDASNIENYIQYVSDSNNWPLLPSPETNVAPANWMVGILVSFWDGLFSRGVLFQFAAIKKVQRPGVFPFILSHWTRLHRLWHDAQETPEGGKVERFNILSIDQNLALNSVPASRKNEPCDTDADFADMTAEECFSWRILLRLEDIEPFRVHPYADSIAIQLSNKNASKYIPDPSNKDLVSKQNPPGNDPITHLTPISGRNLKIHQLPHIRAAGWWCAGYVNTHRTHVWHMYTYIWFISMPNVGTMRAHDCKVISLSRKPLGSPFFQVVPCSFHLLEKGLGYLLCQDETWV